MLESGSHFEWMELVKSDTIRNLKTISEDVVLNIVNNVIFIPEL